MTTGKFTLVIRWPSGQSTICGEMTDHQHGEICRILSPDYRAQLPSQGGEAVAWRVTGRGGLTVTAQYPEWAEADRLLTITPLYTHPADQVAELGAVFDSVRELIREELSHAYHERKTTDEALDAIRALLEQKP